MPIGANSSASSRTLPSLWLAMTTVSPRLSSPVMAYATVSFCSPTSSRDALSREHHQLVELLLAEGLGLRRPLHLDDAAGAGHHEIRVRVGFGILGIVEIEHGLSAIEPARHGGDVVAQHAGLHHVARLHPGDRVMQRDPRAGDRGGARAAIGLQHVAIDDDLLLAERGKIGDGAERAADQALDLLGAARLLAGRGFAPRALGGGARQHAVFGRHPAPPLALEPRRHRLSRCRGAQHMGLAEADEAGAFGMARDRALEADGAKRVGRAF